MTIVAPCDADEMGRFMPKTLEWDGPIYIRLAKGRDEVVSTDDAPFEIGKAILMRDGTDALLVTTGLHDSQVQYWEPAKWVAKLRELKTDDNMLLLHTQMKAGHGGASGRLERYKRTALEYAFFLNLLGVKK